MLLRVFLTLKKPLIQFHIEGCLRNYLRYIYVHMLLIESYLTERSQCVVVNGASSQPVHVLSGVPQGSVLGPLLFIILFYVNTLTNLKLSGGSKLVMYADGLVLHKAIITEEEWIPFQDDINSIVQWVDENLLTLNTSKCKCMLLTRKVNTMPHLFLNNDLIEEVRSYKYLGVTVSTDLKWDMHITSI